MTWEEVEERIAKGACEAARAVGEGPDRPWEDVPEDDRQIVRDVVRYVVQGAIAAGYAIVPREMTPAMARAREMAVTPHIDPDAFNDQWVYHAAVFQPEWLAALSAGEIKPEEAKAVSEKLEPEED